MNMFFTLKFLEYDMNICLNAFKQLQQTNTDVIRINYNTVES